MSQDPRINTCSVPSSSLSYSQPSGGHQRSESDVSHSYSVLDFYDNETIGVGDVTDFNFSKVEEPILDTCHPLHNGSDRSPTASTISMGHRSVDPSSNNKQIRSSMRANACISDISASLCKSSHHSTLAFLDDPVASNIPPGIPPLTAEVLEQSLDCKYDIYGFKKDSLLFSSSTELFNAWFKEYIPHFQTQKKKWLVQMKTNGLASASDAVPLRFPPKSEKIKKLVRRGIPPEWRGNAWFFYAGGHEKLNKNIGVYTKIVSETSGIQNKDTEVVERDLNRTFPDNKFFKSRLEDSDGPELPMISALRRVLIAFALYKPKIGYCQSLNFLAGLLLLFMSEEGAFWMLVIITEKIIPQVHSANLEGVHTDQGVLMICIHEYVPKLWSVIGKSFDGTVLKDDKILTRPPPLTLVTSAWFMSMFVGILPIETVLRFWDIIFYEGLKTLFRLSLTICRLAMEHPNFVARESRNAEEQEIDRIEIFQFIQNFPKSITDPNLLVNLCFKKIGGYGFGFLSQDEIDRCREFVAQQRSRLRTKRGALAGVDLSDLERAALQGSAKMDDEIHDVYGFQRSITSGMAWNMHISSVMKKKLAKKVD